MYLVRNLRYWYLVVYQVLYALLGVCSYALCTYCTHYAL